MRIFADKHYDLKSIYNIFGKNAIIPPRKKASSKIRGSAARARKVRNELADDFSILRGKLGTNLAGEVASGASGSIPGSSLADFIVMEYTSARKGSSMNSALHEILEKILKTESQRMKYFVYVEKAILKHRGIIEHTWCRKPFDYPGRKLIDRIMADVESLVSG